MKEYILSQIEITDKTFMQLIHRKTIIKSSPVHGFGVFAMEALAANDIIEECYSLVTQAPSIDFANFYFGHEERYALPLGSGALFNHSNEPNATFEFDLERNIMTFRAIKPIQAGEEIYIFYGHNWFKERQLKEKIPSRQFRTRQFFKKCQVILRLFCVVSLLMIGVWLLPKIH